MIEDMDLTDRLRRLAGMQPREAGPRVKQALLAVVRARRSRRITLWLSVAAALLCIALVLRFAPLTRRSAPVVYAYQAPGFVALPYAESGVPLETVVVVRVRMGPAELNAIGVAVPAFAPSAQVTADLLVGQDGVARAVRFVP